MKGDRPRGLPLSIRDVDRFVKHIAAVAGVRTPFVSSHMFRATHGADLRHIEGYDLPAIAERLGHADISTTDRYIPKRKRISKKYRSLREYWREFETLWETTS
jgi:integrase